ncbi:MAG: hypothetical protein LZF86_60024 [Nitrospira sp.]|nr:MAG: hypothetical protein LZF86_60024 [Nitrospira sp.]
MRSSPCLFRKERSTACKDLTTQSRDCPAVYLKPIDSSILSRGRRRHICRKFSKAIRSDGNGIWCEWRTDQGEVVWSAKMGVKQGIAEQQKVRN